jgi:hypothetical protein
MRKLKILGFFCIAILSLQSCNKDEYEVISKGETIPTASKLRNLFDQQLANITTVKTFDASGTLNYTSPNGVKLTIYGSCLRKNGSPVTGKVQVVYAEIFDRGSMLITNKPTMGKSGSTFLPLLSGGEFYIQALQEGVELTSTCAVSLEVPTSLTGGTDTTMTSFDGNIDSNGELTWEQSTSFDFIVSPQSVIPTYNAFFQDFGWFNCDRFSATTGPKTTITTLVPSGYNTVNTAVYLTTKSIPNSLGKSYGQFPVGMDCNIIFITEKDGKFRYAIKPQILTANHEVTFSLSETSLATASELTAIINALP